MYHYANAFEYFLEQTTPIFCLHFGQIKTKSTLPKSVSLCNKTREDWFFISELGANNIRLQSQTGFGQSKDGRLFLELSRPTFKQTTPDFSKIKTLNHKEQMFCLWIDYNTPDRIVNSFLENYLDERYVNTYFEEWFSTTKSWFLFWISW